MEILFEQLRLKLESKQYEEVTGLIILLGNIMVLCILAIGYFIFRNTLEKKMFYDVTFLTTYQLFISPCIIAIFNLIVLLVAYPTKWYFAVLPLIIPIASFVFEYINEKLNDAGYEKLKKEILPLVISEFKKVDFLVRYEEISTVYYKQMGKKNMKIIIETDINTKEFMENVVSIENNINKHVNIYRVHLIIEKKRSEISRTPAMC